MKADDACHVHDYRRLSITRQTPSTPLYLQSLSFPPRRPPSLATSSCIAPTHQASSLIDLYRLSHCWVSVFSSVHFMARLQRAPGSQHLLQRPHKMPHPQRQLPAHMYNSIKLAYWLHGDSSDDNLFLGNSFYFCGAFTRQLSPIPKMYFSLTLKPPSFLQV